MTTTNDDDIVGSIESQCTYTNGDKGDWNTEERPSRRRRSDVAGDATSCEDYVPSNWGLVA